MQILTPESVKSDKELKIESDKQMARKASKEVDTLTKRLNEMRAKEITYLAENPELASGQYALEAHIVTLQAIVMELETRREATLRPIETLRTEAETLLKQAKIREKETIENKEVLDEEYEKLDDSLDALELRREALERREKGILASEEAIKRSSEELAKKWVEYHEAVYEHNKKSGVNGG